jgi:hypothetical protein
VRGAHRRRRRSTRLRFTAPLAEAAEQLYLTGHRAGLGRHDDSAVIEVLRGAPSNEERSDES